MSDFPKNLHRVAMYLRKSRADVDAELRGEGDTLSKHRQVLRNVADKHGYTITETYEEIVSGERILDRPEMHRLLQCVQNEEYNAVLCMDLDRLGRGNMVDQGLIQEAFKTSNTLIITPRKVYDLQDEFDEEWSEFEAFMARRELKIITRRLQRGRKQSAAQGKSISKKPPYGYLRDETLKLYPDPQTASVVKLIFELAAEGCGMSRIADHLTKLRIATPGGNHTWERSSIYAILKNPAYLGHIVWERNKYVKHPSSPGRYRKIRQRPEDWLVNRQAHEPLVDEATYQRYLNRLINRPKVPNTAELRNPLASLVYCGQCGRSMRRQQTYNRPSNRLLCVTRGCTTKSAAFERVEERIIQSVHRVFSEMVFECPTLTVQFDQTARIQVAEQSVKYAEDNLHALKKQRDKLRDLLEQGVYNVATYVERNNILEEKLQDVNVTLREAKDELEHIMKEQQRGSAATSTTMDIVSAYGLCDSIPLKNALLRSVVERIVFRRLPEWTKPDEFDLEIFLRF